MKHVLIVAMFAVLAAGCSQQSAYEAWGVPSSGIPDYEITMIGEDEPGGLFSAQIADPGWTEEQVKQIAASIIEERRDSYAAVVLRFVSATGMRTAAYAGDAGGAQQLRSAGFDPAEVESHGFPFLGFLRTGGDEDQPAEPADEGAAG